MTVEKFEYQLLNDNLIMDQFWEYPNFIELAEEIIK